MKIEYRSFGVSAVMAGDEGKITGLAAPFNSQTMIGEAPWGFREQIAPGAFSKTLQEADVVFLLNHDTSKPLARKSAGTLTLRESERGLESEAEPPDTSYADDLRKNIKAGNVRGMSFGFEVVKEAWTDDDGNPADKWTGTQRTLQEVKLIEISAVTFPAYGDTLISTRDAVATARDERSKKAKRRADKKAAAEARAAEAAIDETPEQRIKDGTKQRIPEIDADLRAALDLFAKSDVKKLPGKAKQAVALVASAAQHSNHIMKSEGLDGGDAARSNDGEPGEEPTPETPENDDALRASFAEARSRGLKLGY